MRVKRVGTLAAVLIWAACACFRAASAQSVDGWVAAQTGQKGKDLVAVYFVDSKRGWVAGDAGLILHTQDGGRTWAQQRVETTENINDIYFRNKEDGYLLAGNRIFTTDDAGQTWREAARFQPATFGGAEPELYSVRFTSKKKGWAVGSLSRSDRIADSLLLYTDDGGTSWQRQRVPTQDEIFQIDFAGEKRGWVVGSSGVILHTSDGGQTWTKQLSNTTETLYHVDFRNERTGWAVGSRGTILLTDDGGQTWRVVSSPVRATLLKVAFINDEDGWAVGRGGVILRSGDGGRTWIQQQSPTKTNLYGLFVDKNRGWAVGGDGYILQYEQ
ncbi:MAG TPA: YCF48-related protein [Pyrinomonadaceae bacterium]|nr:YCF48-related protein [Pyrinomonadaceae bacterium]